MTQNILFTCAGRRNYLINYFKSALNGNGTILAADHNRTAPSLLDADIAIILPSITDPEYIGLLIEAINDHGVTAVISLNDHELPVLSKNKKRIEETGAKVIISDENVIDIAFDKWKTHQFLTQIGLKSPQSFISLKETVDAINSGQVSFPVVLKPRWGSASINVFYVHSIEELKLTHSLQLLQLQKSRKDLNPNEAIIIQEMLDGIEYGMDVLNDLNGNYVGSFCREKLYMKAGETDKAVSIIHPELSEIGKILGTHVKHIGNMDCDVFMCNDGYYVLELNPRFGGGYPFSHEAGINTCAIYIDWLNGIENIERHNNYQDGVMFSKCDRLIKIPK